MTAEQRDSVPTARRQLARRVLPGLVAVLVVGLLAIGNDPASAAAPDAWTGSLGDAGNGSTNAGETVITTADAGRVAAAWTATGRTATPYAPAVSAGVAYHVDAPGNLNQASTFTATSARTGATLWTVPVPGSAEYDTGVAVTGHVAVVAFNGLRRPGGVLLVDLQTHRIVWTSPLPAASPALAGYDNAQAGKPYTDGTRVFVSGSTNVINAYRLTDGALLWTAPITRNGSGGPNGVDGIAVGGGVVYTGGKGEGIVAYDAASGRRLWTAPAGRGVPVLAGNRVFATDGAYSVLAVPAAGCGRATCAPQWATSFESKNANWLTVNAADASTVFVTYDNGSGVVARLSATTGAVQWKAAIGSYVTGLVRGGSTIWVFNEYANAQGVTADRILGFSATATGSAPIRIINLAQSISGFPQSLAVASGTLFEQTWATGHLIGYRVPGS